ncbi:flavodoxin domain-containing protein [Pseudolactococcus yaeyamensis]
MKKIAVIYKSNYGATKQYAQWIATALQADLFERKVVTPAMLGDYDCIIYGGGLYASGVIGSDIVAKNPCQQLLVFTVGLADPAKADYQAIMSRAFPNLAYQPEKVWHFRGAIDYSKLGFLHRNLMKVVKKSAEKKPESQRNEDEKVMLATYGQQVDFIDQTVIKSLIDYVNEKSSGMKTYS